VFRSIGGGTNPTLEDQTVQNGQKAVGTPTDSGTIFVDLQISFNQAMDTTRSAITVTAAASSNADTFWLPGDKTWVFNSTLQSFTDYTVRGIGFNADNEPASGTPVSFSFRTLGIVSVTSISPSLDAAEPNQNAPVVVTFSHVVIAKSVSAAFKLFHVAGENGTELAVTMSTQDNTTFTFVHADAFTIGNAYLILIDGATVEDADGTKMALPVMSGFSVVAATTPAPTSSGGLSGGAIAGIVIGVIAGVAILGGVVYYCRRKKKRDYDELK